MCVGSFRQWFFNGTAFNRARLLRLFYFFFLECYYKMNEFDFSNGYAFRQERFFFEVTPNFDEEIPFDHLFALFYFSARRPRELIENIVYLFKGVHKYEMEKRGIFEEFIK